VDIVFKAQGHFVECWTISDKQASQGWGILQVLDMPGCLALLRYVPGNKVLPIGVR